MQEVCRRKGGNAVKPEKKKEDLKAILTDYNARSGSNHTVIEKLQGAAQKLDAFMASQGLACAPQAVHNLKGDEARAVFINHFKQVMGLIARFTAQAPGKQKMSREQLVGLIQSDAKFMDEREDIGAYIAILKAGEALNEEAIRAGYKRFKTAKQSQELADLAQSYGLETAALQAFVDGILQRMIFDDEHLSDLMAPLGLGWKARTQKELALMEELTPLLHKYAQGRDISGLSAYEQ